ncbi:MAG: hypothetical protein CMO55_05985 [Verrucomicrobiales bacterium]|nr:hypothetical protein [Verrucomicrobiales bacterium]
MKWMMLFEVLLCFFGVVYCQGGNSTQCKLIWDYRSFDAIVYFLNDDTSGKQDIGIIVNSDTELKLILQKVRDAIMVGQCLFAFDLDGHDGPEWFAEPIDVSPNDSELFIDLDLIDHSGKRMHQSEFIVKPDIRQ